MTTLLKRVRKRKSLRRDFWRWVLATAGGYAAGGLLAGLLATGWSGIRPVSSLWVGVMIGLWQYWVLRRSMRHSAAWIGITGLAFFFSELLRAPVIPLMLTMFSPNPALSNAPEPVAAIVNVLSYAVFLGIGVGGAQWLFWRWRWPMISMNWIGWMMLGQLLVMLVLVLVPPTCDYICIGGTDDVFMLVWQMIKLAGAGALMGGISGNGLIRLEAEVAAMESS